MLAARGASFLGIPPLVVASLVVANGALDSSPEVEHHAVAITLTYDDDSDHTTIQAGEYRGHRIRLWAEDRSRRVKEGDAVTVWTRSGALGTPWHTRASEVRTETGLLRVE